MKTSSKSLEKCQVKLTVELDAAEVSVVVKDIERTFVREAQLPGFRKGKVPIEIIRKQFANELKRETEAMLFRKYYNDASKAEKLDEITVTGLQNVTYGAEGGGFEAIVDIKPTFKLPTYKGLKISVKDTKIEDSAIDEHIQNLRKGIAKYEEAKEGDVVAEGDYAQIDYEGMVGKKKILEINPEAKIVAEGKGFWTLVQDGHFLPEILAAVKGMKIGETKKSVKAKFDKESAPEGLKGEKATYTVTLKGFRRCVLPTDKELVAAQKVESMAKLRANVREMMEKAAVEQEERRREDEAVTLLMKKVNFDVPESQVRNAINNYLQELAQRAQYSGIDASYFEQNRDKILKDAEETATRQVRLWYVIDAIATAEKIEAKDDEKGKKVIEFILSKAKK